MAENELESREIKMEICEDEYIEEDMDGNTKMVPVPSRYHTDTFEASVLDSIESRSNRQMSKCSLVCYNKWREKQKEQNGEIIPAFHLLFDLPVDQLDNYLVRFVTARRELKDYNHSTLDIIKHVLFSLQCYGRQYCNKFSKSYNAFMSNPAVFPNLDKCLNIMKKDSLEENLKQTHNSYITFEQEALLWDTGIFGCQTAQSLSNTIFFYVIKIFGIYNSTALKAMRVDQFIFSEDIYGKFVEFDQSSLEQQLGHFEQEPTGNRIAESCKHRHYCDSFNPRSFYNLLKYYVDQINKVTEAQFSQLFLQPKVGFRFSPSPIGLNMLKTKFAKIMNEANIEGTYNNCTILHSFYPLLLENGYDVKQQDIFQIYELLEICKILDPPPGNMTIEEVQIQTKCPTKPCLRSSTHKPALSDSQVSYVGLKSVHMSDNQISVKSAQLADISAHNSTSQHVNCWNNPLKFMFAVNTNEQETHGPVNNTCEPQQTHEPVNINENQPFLFLKFRLPPTKMINSPFLPAATTSAKLAGDEATHILTSGNATSTLITTFGKNVKNCQTSTERSTNSNFINDDQPYPMYIVRSNNTTNSDGAINLTDQNADFDTYVHLKNVIKQEQLEENGYCKEFENSSSNNGMCSKKDMMTKKRKFERTSPEVSQTKQLKTNDDGNITIENKKGIHEKNDMDTNECKITDCPQSKECAIKKIQLQTEKNPSENENDSSFHVSRIEYMFINDLATGVAKQEISIEDDGETVFTVTGCNKRNKHQSDIELNLADYLPDDCFLRPKDITLKRIATPNGGKIVIHLQYKMKKEMCKDQSAHANK